MHDARGLCRRSLHQPDGPGGVPLVRRLQQRLRRQLEKTEGPPSQRALAVCSQLTAKLCRVNVPLPSLVPTPFSKKQPPPNESPIAVTLEAAAANPAV